MRHLMLLVLLMFFSMVPGVRHPATAEELPPIYDAEGNAYPLSHWQGKPVLLHFWASWCGPCVEDVPVMHKMIEKYGDELVVLAVSMDVDSPQLSKEEAKERFYAKHELEPLPAHFYDHNFELYQALYIQGLPATKLLDREGNILEHVNGLLKYRYGIVNERIFDIIYGD